MDVRPLLWPSINWERLAPELDEVGDQVRIATVRELGQHELHRLFEGATEQPVTIDELVGDGTPFAHEGHRPGALFSRFAASFALAVPDAAVPAEPGEAIGYEQRRGIAAGGPAYFAAKAAPAGGVVLDFARVPKLVPHGWPQPGAARRERREVLRRVSSTVTVGRPEASRGPHAYFALVRRTGRF